MRALPPAFALALAVCPPAWANSASWYANHDAERNARLAWCRDHPGPAERDDRCKAAFHASGLVEQREVERRLKPPPVVPKYNLKAADVAWLCESMVGANAAARAEIGCPDVRGR